MDVEARFTFERAVHDAMHHDLQEIFTRLEQLERLLVAPRSFTRQELDRQRVEAVRHARQRGLSIGVIAAALGLGRTTVAEIIEREQIAGPDRVVGRDGKRHPAHHHWGPRADGVASTP
jgi:Homeodomain-like domain